MGNVGCVIYKEHQRPSNDLMEQFRNVPVSNLGDCMNRTAALSQRIRPINKTCLLGSAFTVKVPQGDNLMLHKAMDLSQPGDVIV